LIIKVIKILINITIDKTITLALRKQ